MPAKAETAKRSAAKEKSKSEEDKQGWKIYVWESCDAIFCSSTHITTSPKKLNIKFTIYFVSTMLTRGM